MAYLNSLRIYYLLLDLISGGLGLQWLGAGFQFPVSD